MGKSLLLVDDDDVLRSRLARALVSRGMSSEYWLETVTNFGRLFHRAAGRVSLSVQEAARAGKRWFPGHGHCQQAFA
jgi:ActR/RegA family two-component response regulator